MLLLGSSYRMSPSLMVTLLLFALAASFFQLSSQSSLLEGQKLVGSLSESSLIRNTRQTQHLTPHRLYRESHDAWLLRGFRNLAGCPLATQSFSIFQREGEFYAIVATSAAVNNTEIYDFKLEGGCGKLLATLPTRATRDLEVIRTNEGIRLVILEGSPLNHPHRLSGLSVFSLVFDGKLLLAASKGEVLRSENPTCLTSWEQFGVPHLAVCNNRSVGSNGQESFSTHSFIYCASAGYFDHCGSIETHSAQQIRHFRIFHTHYLAVANHPNRTESRDVPTEILRYDLSSQSYRHWQYLPTKAAKDVCFFRLGHQPEEADHFLFVVNQFTFDSFGRVQHDVPSHIYKWVEDRFEPFQAVSVPGAYSCLVHQAEAGQFALVLATPSGAVTYQYNGWRFVPSVQYSQHALGSGIRHFKSLSVGQQLYITVANDNPEMSGADNLFTSTFEQIPPEASLTTLYDKSFAGCNQTRFNLSVDPIGLIFDLYGQAVKKNDTRVQLGRVTFSGSLAAQQVSTNQIDLDGTRRLGAEQITELEKLTKKMDGISARLSAAKQRAKQSARPGGHNVLKGAVRFHSLAVRDGRTWINSTNVTEINSVDLDKLYSHAVLPTGDRIPGSIRLGRLEVDNRVETEILSDTDVFDYIQVDEMLVLNRTLRVDGSVRINGHLSVVGLVDGQSVSSELLLINGDQTLNWNLKANKVQVANQLKADVINGQDVNKLYDGALNRSANFTLMQPTFNGSYLNASKMELTGLINGINLTELDTKYMKLSGNQVVTGVHYFYAANLRKAVLDGQLNGLHFPDDFITVTENDTLRIGKLQLNGQMAFSRLNVSHDMSGLPVLPDGRLSIGNFLNKTKPDVQVITGRKKFDKVESLREVACGTINGRPLDHFDTNSSRYGQPDIPLVFDHIETDGNVHFELAIKAGLVDGVDIHRLMDYAVPLTIGYFPSRDSPLWLANVEVNGDLKASKVDGMSTSKLVMKGETDKRKQPFVQIEARKTFANGLAANVTFSVLYHLNGYNLTDHMQKALKIDEDQIVPGSVVIENDVNVVSLEATSSPFVMLDYTGPIGGRKHFDGLSIVGDWFANKLSVTGQINEVDVNVWSTDTVFKNRPNQTIMAQKAVERLVVDDISVLSVDDLDIDRLTDLVSTDHPVTIHSDLIIKGSVATKNLSVQGSVDGVNSDAPVAWLRYGVDQNVSGSIVVLNGTLDVEEYNQANNSWLVNGVDIADLVNRTYHTDQPASFGSLHFGHVIVENLVVNGTVQDVRPSDLVLRSASDRPRVTGKKSFKAPLVSKSLVVESRLNGQDPHHLCNFSIPPQTSAWLVVGNVTIRGQTPIKASTVNNRNLTDLLLRLWKKSSDVELSAEQKFRDVVVNGTLAEALINTVNVSDVYRRAVKLTSAEPQRITAAQRLTSVHVGQSLTVDHLTSWHINGFSVNDLSGPAVLLRDVEQDIPNRIVFQNVTAAHIVVDGKVNGVDLNGEVVRSDRPNVVVSGRKVLTSLSVKDALELCPSCLLNGTNLSSLTSKAVLRTGNLTLSNPVRFENIVFQQPLTLHGQLNNVSVDRSRLLTLTGEQTVHGHLVLSSHLPESINYSTQKSKSSAYQEATEDFSLAARFGNLTVNGLYEGVNLSHFYDQSARRNAPVAFEAPIVLSALLTDSLADASAQSTLQNAIQGSAPRHFAPAPEGLINGNLSKLVSQIERIVSQQKLELKFFMETTAPQLRTARVDNIFAWSSGDGRQMELCYYTEAGGGQLFYHDPQPGSDGPLLSGVEVTSATSATTGEFAVATLNGAQSRSSRNGSYIFGQSAGIVELRQTIPTEYPLDSDAFVLTHNRSCYIFVEKTANSSIYCRQLGSRKPYKLFQYLPVRDARLVAVGASKGPYPVLAISSAGRKGHSRVIIWDFNVTSDRFEARKSIVTLEFVSMDCICSEDGQGCLLATVAPSKPAAIPGQVIIWSLSGDGQPSRLQRLPFIEPADAKFALLPDGRLSLLVLQCSGVDNVLVFVWRNLLQFQHVTTVRVPGARNLQRLATPSQFMLALTISPPKSSVDNSTAYAALRTFEAHFFGKLG